ncbi:MAG: helix-turn-helix transcriptional regulator [Nitrospirae bacterium]|nr:helix-turn-helix transcriptional regulator [Nitrospirota bacterium]
MKGNEFIKLNRMRQGLSLRELAIKSGMSHTQIRLIEDGAHDVLFNNLIKILDGLKISMHDYLSVIGYVAPIYRAETMVGTGGIEPPPICNAVLQADSQAA